MDFRKINDSEFESVLDLLDDAFPVTRDYIEKDLRIAHADPKASGDIYGLWIDGELISTATYGACYGIPFENDLGQEWNGEGCMFYLAVAEKHRRKGYAKWIINRAIEDLKAVGSPCLAVCVLEEDEVSMHLWESFGFECYDKAFTKDDHGTMSAYALWF